MRHAASRRAFTLRDLTTLTALATIAAAVFVPVAARAGGQSRMSICMSRLKSIGMSTARFALDHQDRLAALQGKPGQTVQYGSPGLGQTITYPNTSEGDITSINDQAIDILRRRGGRSDLDRIGTTWLSAANFSHLALVDHDQEALPSSRWACPEDSTLLTWQSDPENFNNLGVPSPPGPGGLPTSERRWPYISSYQRGTYIWSADLSSPNTTAWHFTDNRTYTRMGGFTSGRSAFGQRLLSEVRFPSSKIYLWDRGARHFTPTAVYWNFQETKQPMLYFDGGVITTRTTRTGTTRHGWNWNAPSQLGSPWVYIFNLFSANDEWQPGFPDGSSQGQARMTAAYFATTRDGLRGSDLPIVGGQ